MTLPITPFFNINDYSFLLRMADQGFKGKNEKHRGRMEAYMQEVYLRCGNGAYVIDNRLTPYTVQIAERCRELGSRMIIGLQVSNPGKHADKGLIAAAASLTPHLGLGNSKLAEFGHRMKDFNGFVDLCGEFGATWCCPLVYLCMLNDLKGFHLRDRLLRLKIPVYVLCGYSLALYLHGMPCPRHQRACVLHDPHNTWGVTIENLRTWLEPLDAHSGCGRGVWLQRGSMPACEAVGFKGLLCRPPWPETYPTEPLERRKVRQYRDMAIGGEEF